MQYKIIFDDNANDLIVVPTHINTEDYIGFSMVFETHNSATTFVKLVDSLFVASWMKDTKMFVRIFNRLLTFK